MNLHEKGAVGMKKTKVLRPCGRYTYLGIEKSSEMQGF